MLWDIWWVWVAAALALAILEVLAPTFIFAGFSFGALIVGLLLALGLAFSLPWALVVFAVLSVVAWVVMRRLFGVRHGQVKTFKRDINDD